MQRFKEMRNKIEYVGLSTVVLLSIILLINMVAYAGFGSMTLLVTMLIASAVMISLGITGMCMRFPISFLIAGIIGIVFHTLTNSATVQGEVFFLLAGIVSMVGAVLQGFFIWKEKVYPQKKGILWLFVSGGLCLLVFCYVFIVTALANGRDYVTKETWAVPNKYDEVDCPEKGTVQRISYETKAYATDERVVTKEALVYLPYDYSEEIEYNILYLMHGTGDDENYWLETHGYNKTMIDNMIYYGDIEPLIIVTPTFYVEDDCADDLDQLAKSFAKELRNDLMPVIESEFATYANKKLKNVDISSKGEELFGEIFAETREHRGFAGLSRGAVTMYHSAMFDNLSYFSWFGAFSGSRITEEAVKEQLQSKKQGELTIDYLYVVGGTLDFALPRQIEDYEMLLENDARFVEGENVSLHVTPFFRHSIRNWHLNLYNFLQIVFVKH